ncbi:MAG: hypothetical protein GY868_15395, partial [Deltaproteobacteria bacterium]|nr:hypothetical protein [Deltaproteobacteria bacterium]
AAELLNTNSTTVETVNLIAGTGQGAQQNGALRAGAQTAVTRPPQAVPDQTPQAAAQSSTDSYYHTLEIEVSRDGDTLKTVTTNRGAVEEEETLRQFEEKTFNPDTIDDKCAEVIRLLNNANLRGAIAGENLSQLKSTGFALFEDLLPQDTQKKLADTTCENLIINIDDGLVHIPWELLYDGTSFICMKFNVGRVVRTRQKITKAQAKKLPVP